MLNVSEELRASLSLIRRPDAIYLTGSDHLRMRSWCASSGVTALTLTGRFISAKGDVVVIQERHVPNTDRTIATSIHGLGDGWLENLQITSNGSPLVGQVFVRLSIVRGQSGGVTPIAVLAQGFCNAVQPLAWPGSAIVTTTERPGALRVVTGTNPAAGAEFLETVPTGARWRLLAVSARLATDANVANRRPGLQIDDGAKDFGIFYAGAVLPAADAGTYYWAPYANKDTGFTAGSMNIPITPLVLFAGFRILSTTVALQVGDDWGAPGLLVEEWLEGAA